MIKYIVKFAPEITIKTRPVRKRFVARLKANIVKILRQRNLSADVVLNWDMLEVVIALCHHETEDSLLQRGRQVHEVLVSTPGIAHVLDVVEKRLPESLGTTEQVLSFIASEVEHTAAHTLANKTFVVRCKRKGEHSYSSHDIERHVGAHLLNCSAAAGVSLRNAEVTVALELKEDRLFIVSNRSSGLGGYPLGSVGQVLSLMSGGYDSSVASFETIRRGMETHFLFFNLGGHAHEIGVKQVSHFLWENYASSHRTGFISVSFERVVEEILEKVSNPYMGVVLKRMMMRAASKVADEMGITTLVTGESVAQVSSQTLQNLAVIDQIANVFTMRPLIASDKSDIIAKAQKVGVACYAEHMPEYCAVISDKPTTAAKLSRVEKEEEKFDFSILDEAISHRNVCGIDSVYEKERIYDDIEQLQTPQPEQIVIDLRAEDERERKPLLLHANTTLDIPFYKINRLFTELDASKQYLLYCDRGVMSKIHAAHLRAEGFKNVMIYQPSS